MQLSAEKLGAFDQQGYVFLLNCFCEQEIALLRAEADNILKLDRQEVWREKTGAPRAAGGGGINFPFPEFRQTDRAHTGHAIA
jgi:hypothetical protein